VAIADDEPLARERLTSLLEGRERYTVVAECNDGAEALAALTDHDIDLLFLDVQMPGLDGFQFLESLGNAPLPMIVFVTAFNDYALRAFDVSALDYLLKPFDRDRFEKTLARVEERIAARQQGEAEGNYVALHAAGRRHLVRDTIKSLEGRLDPVKFVRVHRSAIINVDRLRKLQPYFHGEYVITLQDGTTLTSSRTYSDRLRALLEQG